MNTGKRMKRMKSDDPVANLYPMDFYAYYLGLWFINFVNQNFMIRLINWFFERLTIEDDDSNDRWYSPKWLLLNWALYNIKEIK